jgi:S1-C subfamily serine protease
LGRNATSEIKGGGSVLTDEPKVIEAIKKVSSSVVNITTARVFRHFHWYFFHEVPIKGVGSGTIIDPDGLILTNNHVIEGTREVDVVLTNGEKYTGRVAGADRATDIAVVKVEGGNLPVCEMGDSSQLRVGQIVFALGNSLGLAGGPTVTGGLISAVSRSIQFPGGILENLIQTDAAINPGNSGGPLVDTEGQVIGINTAIIPYAQGIGFAIPINSAKEVAEELKIYGRIIRPWLGIYGRDVTQVVAAYYGLTVEKGALVMRTVPNSPADKAGIEPGDVILAVDTTPVENMRVLTREIKKRKAHEELEVEFQRGYKRLRTKVILEELF